MKRQRRRTLIQALTALGQNAYLPGFFRGVIFQGKSKVLCVPGLNCYSCPGALGACPIGALQAALGQRRFPSYVLGTLVVFGVLLGRLVCGFLCPFGLLQDLLDRVPLPKLKVPKRLDKPLRYLKYAVLVLLVVLALAGMRGTLFYVKLGVLVAIVLLSLTVFRPFCKYLCPLGAFYGLFNGAGLYRMAVAEEQCVRCGQCLNACPMAVDVVKSPNSPECIRCGKCIDSCPHNAISGGFRLK